LTHSLVENLALGKTAEQKSTHRWHFLLTASMAVDGDMRGLHDDKYYMDNTMAHTGHTWAPWWKVDLGAVYDVGTIRFKGQDAGYDCNWNQGSNVVDLYGTLMHRRMNRYGFVLEVSKDDATYVNCLNGTTTPEQYGSFWDTQGLQYAFCNTTSQARYVRITLPMLPEWDTWGARGHWDYLVLQEVEVFQKSHSGAFPPYISKN
jgi:hypothetical protein